MKNDEIYIGWMDKAPGSVSRFIRKILLIILALVTVIAICLSLLQKKFSKGNFEFGKLTELKGIYFDEPVPSLKVMNGKDIFGRQSFITVLLVGYGKFGASGAIKEVENKKKISLNQKEISLKGTLLYNEGKLLMQIDRTDSFLVSVGAQCSASSLPVTENLGDQTLNGEIVDPKCFFGVMKPGEGKPHKDCAIRCILGGMPPVLKVVNTKGNSNYYLIAGVSGEKLNEAIKAYVGEAVSVRASVVKYDDWILLYVNEKGISRYSYIQEHFGDQLASCGKVCEN